MKKTKRLLLIAATASLMATATFAAPSIDVAAYGSGAAFSTDFNYGQAWVRITGPNSYVQELEIGSLDDLAFQLDASAADGKYSWEILAVQPIGEVLRSKLDAAAASGDRGVVDRLKASGELQSATFFGTFQLNNGVVQTPTKSFSSDDQDIQLKAQVVTQDQIIQGSQCIGVDCTTSESFGSDTLRFKENNLRIHFNDTSASASFPDNDWRITINDSTNGGDNYFAIQDATGNKTPFRIDAGAPSNSIRVKSDGKVGIGTSNPAINLHIVEGNSPTLRLEQDGSDGFQSQTWDIAGNETNWFLRDVNNGSALPIRVRPGSGNDDGIVLLGSGDVGLGTDSAKADLHVLGGGSVHTPTNDAVVALFQNNADADTGAILSLLAGNGTANAQFWFGDADNDKAGRMIYRNGVDALSFYTNGTEQFYIEADGGVCIGCNDAQGDALRHSNGAHLTSGGVWTNASSRSLKQDITELSGAEAMAALDGLAPVTYRYHTELDETYVGFIAEDVPELVAMKNRKSLTSMDVVAVLTKVVQEQQKAIEALTERLNADEIE
ncbi:MAG: tail fiber domain-containing protein [Acidobacteriota bacterium]